MAKQAGIHGLRGKVNGMSYYYSKNGGELTRKINEGIGERVKSSAAYVNTRKNNAEFGAAGASAGAIMRTIPQKYRYILKSTATGLLNKEINNELKFDSVNAWGQRQIVNPGQNRIIEFFNTLSKNNVPGTIKDYIVEHMFYDSDTNVVFNDSVLETNDLLIEELRGSGATHITILCYSMVADLPVFSNELGGYSPVSSRIQPLSTLSAQNVDLVSGEEIFAQVRQNTSIGVENDDPTQINGLFFVILPQRKVGNGYNTLQELCSAAWIPAKSGTVPEP